MTGETGEHTAVSPAPADTWRTWVLPALVSITIGAVGWWASTNATMAVVDAQLVEHDRRITALEEAHGSIVNIQQDIAALSARVDAWRTTDVAARAIRDQSIEQRLERIEDALYRR